jgi:cytochrome P450
MVRPALLNRLPTRDNRAYHSALHRLRRTVDDVIADRRATGADHGDLLSALLTAHDPESGTASTMTARELGDQVLAFFIAGGETTANALTWALYQLATHPEIQDRLHAEASAADGPTALDRLPALDLTAAVITETLRLHTSAWLITRITTTRTTLGDVDLPVGTSVAYSPRLLHYRPDLYQDPESFDPDRWLDTRPDRTAYLPFGGGPRKCIGERFAQSEAALALAEIITHWTVEPVTHPPATLALQDVLVPPGLLMRVCARRPAAIRTA